MSARNTSGIQRGLGTIAVAATLIARNSKEFLILLAGLPLMIGLLAYGSGSVGFAQFVMMVTTFWLLPVVVNLTAVSLESGGRGSLASSLRIGFGRLFASYFALFVQLLVIVMAMMLVGLGMMAVLGLALEYAPRLLAWTILWMVPILAIGVAIPLASWYLIVGTFAGSAGMFRGLRDALAAPFRSPVEHLVVHFTGLVLGVGVCMVSKGLHSVFSPGVASVAENPLALTPDFFGTLVVAAPVVLFITVGNVVLVRSEEGRSRSV